MLFTCTCIVWFRYFCAFWCFSLHGQLIFVQQSWCAIWAEGEQLLLVHQHKNHNRHRQLGEKNTEISQRPKTFCTPHTGLCISLHLWQPWSRRHTPHWPSPPPALSAGNSQRGLQVTWSWIWSGELSLWHFLCYYCPGSALIWKGLQSGGSPEHRAQWRSAVPGKRVKTQTGDSN